MPIIYYLESRQNKKKDNPIRLSVDVKSARIQSTTQINKYLNGVEGVVLEFENTCKVRPSLEKLKEIIHRYNPDAEPDGEETHDEPRRPSTVEVFSEFTKDERLTNQWTAGTMQIWNAFEKHLKAVVKQQNLSFFNNDGINAFVRYLRVRAKMQENSVQKHYLNLRWFLNWAIRRGYASEKEIGKIQPKFKLVDKPIIFLTKEELLKLYNYAIPANGSKVKLHNYEGKEYEKVVHDAGPLAKTRDMFCFCAFTSLRYSDMANLKRTDIAGDTMYITTQKTHDRLPINLNSFAKEILAKYEDQRFPGGAALPVISNQKMNDYLKNLCELCEFNAPITTVTYRAGKRVETTKPKYELIGTHAGRRTFICFALASGIPPQVVMKWTGHSDYKAMKPYIDIAEKVKAEQMAIFEKNLKG